MFLVQTCNYWFEIMLSTLLQHEERAFVLKFSAIEIYNEVVRDLLSSENTSLRLWDDAEVRKLLLFFCTSCLFACITNVLILYTLQKGTYVENLKEVILRDWNHIKELISVCEGGMLFV